MFLATVEHLRCLNCQGTLEVRDSETELNEHSRSDILWGRVICRECDAWYPILAGVLLYVSDVENALIQHIKGICKLVSDDRIPAEHLAVFTEARESLTEEGFFDQGLEEDLEADRVNALYVMNHYLRAQDVPKTGNPVFDSLIQEHWDHGPLKKTAQWIRARGLNRVVEFGSSVGGLAQRLGGIERYLGIDASFASVALARHLALGAPYPNALRIPQDLIDGPSSMEVELSAPTWTKSDQADFIFADIHSLSLAPGEFDASVALGLIDMLDEPGVLVFRQREALASGGIAIQASPYIWHEPVARGLRGRFPQSSSEAAVLALYREGGLRLIESQDSILWVFYKHHRQVELYSVHWSAHEV